MSERSPIWQLAHDYVERSCELDPIKATAIGVPGYDDRLTDYSPDGVEERVALDRETLTRLAAIEPVDAGDRAAAAFMTERLGTSLAFADAGEHLRCLRNIASPLQSIRQVFDLMGRASVTDWELIARRMEAVPAALASLRASLAEGLDRGLSAARRQALEAARQAHVWAGGDEGRSYFEDLVASADPELGLPAELRTTLDEAAVAAAAAFDEMARWLREAYAPRASERDAVGADRYELFARASLGAAIDLVETYEWGWEELTRIEREMREVCSAIGVASSIEETIDWLETGSDLVIEGEDALRAWLQDLMDRTIEELDGVHFDIPDPVKRVEAMIAPPGGAAAMYYTGPSEDFSRPGRTWYPTLGRTRFPLWGEVSIAYHEGVPGHHLQIGQVRYLRDQLNRFQRTSGVSGHAEGWALYAERLMDELGSFDRPEYRLGYLRAQALRAVRVIVDIGMHLELAIPTDQAFHPGERWTPELGQQFVNERSRFPLDFMASEIVRYLGWPGQAISYKVGERVWLQAREAVRRQLGDDFDLRSFHRYALNLGPLGLDLLHEELLRFAGPPRP
ncbi:MAG: DUF885 domain-containing protein [Acidimicrobiales bacterium]